MTVSESEDKKPKDSTNQQKPVFCQFGTSALGEVAAFSIALGAVYMSERMFPKQMKVFISRLAEQLGNWRGTSADSNTVLAKQIIDVGIMNVAGASGMAVQFGVRRSLQTPEEKKPLGYEAGRLATGRIVGTATAVGALAFVSSKAPYFMKIMQSGISKGTGDSARSERFAELFVSNAVQSVGAVAGNAPAQLIYDHLVNGPEKGVSKS